MDDLRCVLKSKFVVLDGLDGCGKTTQQKVLVERLEADGLDVVSVCDPGTTSAGEAIRRILLSGDYGSLSGECELLLFMAARAQMMEETILPALASGRVVLSDRFISASCAYQGASGVSLDSVIQIGEFASRSTWPDLTIVLDLPVDTALARVRSGKGGQGLDAMERRSLDFHQRVREIFLQLPDVYPGPVEVVDSDGTIEQVHRRVMEALSRVVS